jgi:hypothetical protein
MPPGGMSDSRGETGEGQLGGRTFAIYGAF